MSNKEICMMNYTIDLGPFFNHFYGIATIIGLIITIVQISKLIEKFMNKKIAVLFPVKESSGENQEFWDDFREQIEAYGHENKWNIEKKYPEISYDYDSQYRKIIELNFNEYKSVIISPVEDRILETPDIKDLIRKNKVVFHDISAHRLSKFFAQNHFKLCRFVCIDNEDGGRIAANELFDNLVLKYQKRENFEIIIIPGNNFQEHSNQRVNGFIEKMKELSNHKVSFSISPAYNWNRQTSQDEFLLYARDYILPRKLNIDGIFACNDEMAIGAFSAIKSFTDPDLTLLFNNTLVVGFDYSDFMKEFMSSNSKIIGTVDSRAKEQATKCLNLITEISKSKFWPDSLSSFHLSRGIITPIFRPNN